MTKTFSVAGVSTLDGVRKFRVANGTPVARAKVLERGGHTEINLFALEKPLTKEQAFEHLRKSGFTESKSSAAKATKEVPARKLLKEVGLKVVKAPKLKKSTKSEVVEPLTVANLPATPSTKSLEEVARIKAKNIETMRRVTEKLKAIRDY